jgi:hypothetical protein
MLLAISRKRLGSKRITLDCDAEEERREDREEEKRDILVWPISGKDLGSTFQVN